MINFRHHRTARSPRWAVGAAPLAVAITLLLAACAGSSSDTDATDSSPATTDAPQATEPPEPVEASTSSPVVSEPEPGEAESVEGVACDSDPVVMTTAGGIDYVRTPDSCFADLPDWPYEAQYLEIDGLRQGYVDEGPADGEVVLLLHGQPSWSYLYRDMIPVLADAGYRVIAMDHLGMGRSDKPIDIEAYSYLGHNDRLEAFIDELALRDINVFVQDWGSLIGLNVAGTNPELFATIAVGDGTLVPVPAGVELFPPVEDPDEVADIESPFAAVPAQQVPFYDGCELLLGPDEGYFGDWMAYAMTAESFEASEVVEAMTWYDVTPVEEAAYDAPFPSREYMAGPRSFPSLANQLGGNTAEGWAGLTTYENPFLTLWASNDPGQLGSCEAQQRLIDNVPGAAGQPHDRLAEASHFLQDDQGTELATRLVDWYATLDPTGGETATGDETAAGDERVGFELLERMDDGTLRAWVSANPMTLEQFEAIELRAGWIKNQPRESSVDGGVFDASPGADEVVYEEHFGFRWFHSATVVEVGVPVDDEGLLAGSLVEKVHQISYEPGSTVIALVSPDGETYVRIGRDAGRATDEATLPTGWEITEIDVPDGYTTTLPVPTLVIRTDNRDSYQGPVSGL
ncbi:MAG: haloalkane dehalogenase [Ilumatobacteraceae bacterium]|nr:haloalkane dehalogenase [Ilumatobacteraceae bacterium]